MKTSRRKRWLGLIVSTYLLAAPAFAQSEEVAAVRAEIEALKEDFEARLAALEARLEVAERRERPPTPEGATRETSTTATVTAGNAFNPQISLILDGSYLHDQVGGQSGRLVGEALQPSLPAGGDGDHGHGGSTNGLSFGEAELAISATVDPYFDAGAYLAIDGEGEVDLEEAWLQTRALPYGFKLKGGRFLSDFGYINRQHPHQWDFADQNLPYLNLFGDHGLRDMGVQITWLPDLPLYTLLGAEILEGDQERFGSLVEDDDLRSELGLGDTKDGPRLWNAFFKVGPDLGYSHALQLGASYAHNRQHQEAGFAAEGDADTWGVDVVYKYDHPAAWGHRDLKLQAEYLRSNKDLAVRSGDATGHALELATDGYYLQSVYGIAPRWQLGLRYDVLGNTNRVTGATDLTFDESDRWTAVLNWLPSEFSLFRLQYERGDVSSPSGQRDHLNALRLQFQVSLGTHGQHQF